MCYLCCYSYYSTCKYYCVKRDLDITDELLVKYLLDEASNEEQVLLQQWLDADAANRKEYEQFRLIWEQSRQLELRITVDPDAAWERFQKRVQDVSPAETTQPKRVSLFSFTRVAAALVLLITASISGYRYFNPAIITLQASDRTLIQTLPDGSVVTLNKHARLSYPEHFRKNTRDVTLSGECFFDISPDKQHPFIISTNDVHIKVVGTSFNVNSNARTTEVIVETGIVEVSKDTQRIRLNPNEKATVNKSTGALIKQRSEDLFYNYYRTHEFVCSSTPLWRLANVLSEAYQVQIIIHDPRIRALELTTVFKDEPLDNILAVICDTFGLKAEKEGTTIILQ